MLLGCCGGETPEASARQPSAVFAIAGNFHRVAAFLLLRTISRSVAPHVIHVSGALPSRATYAADQSSRRKNLAVVRSRQPPLLLAVFACRGSALCCFGAADVRSLGCGGIRARARAGGAAGAATKQDGCDVGCLEAWCGEGRALNNGGRLPPAVASNFRQNFFAASCETELVRFRFPSTKPCLVFAKAWTVRDLSVASEQLDSLGRSRTLASTPHDNGGFARLAWKEMKTRKISST